MQDQSNGDKRNSFRKTGPLALTVAWAFLAALFLALPAQAALLLNMSTTFPDPSKVYVTFQTSSPTTFSASYVDATTSTTQQITINTHDLSPSIQLSSIKDGVITLNTMISGLIYASVGGPLGQTAAPAPTNSGDPAYNTPWQNAAEITYSGANADSGDITSIQFFAVNATVQVLAGSKILQTAGFNVPASTLYDEIAALSSTPTAITIKSTKAPNVGQIVRVLAPNQFGKTKNSKNTNYYSIGGFASFQAYVQSVHDANVSTQIKGNLGPGAYNFISTVDAAGNIITTGNYGTGVTYTITMPPDFPLTDGSGMTSYVQSSMMYFCPSGRNADSVIVTSDDGTSGASMNNSELAQVLHDLCTGYNFGFINSPTLDPVTHVPFGTEASNVWFKNATGKTVYAGLQPNHPYFNQYAELISSASNGSCYGFPYADAVAGVTLFTVKSGGQNVTAWNIIIGDTIATTDSPVMPSWALGLFAILLMAGAFVYLSPRRTA